jgi:glycosyltransferase involved in cell wall biosynthesis
VLVNAAGSTSGGGRVYVLGLLDELRRGGDRGIEWEFVVEPELPGLLGEQPAGVRLSVRASPSAVRRVVWEQLALPLRAWRGGFDVLVCAANFGPLAYGRRQVLLQRNPLYFSDDAEYAGWAGLRIRAEGKLARASVRRAAVVVTASKHMAAMVTAFRGEQAVCIPFGPGIVAGGNGAGRERFTFLHRTTWGAHKRFGDLLEAVRELAGERGRRFVVRSACDPRTAFARRFAESAAERELLEDPAVASHVEFASFTPSYGERLAGDAVVMPSVTESFCFPIAEAVGGGLPVVAADTPFARELVGGAGVLVEPRDPAALAAGMRRLIDGEQPPAYPEELRERVSWPAHADRLASVCESLAAAASSRGARPSS